MKADLTRSTFRPGKHYDGVRMQQGRVQVDADWNEQVDIDAYLDQTTRVDVIGRSGVPRNDAGFGVGITPDGSDLTLGPGRIYVDGILCELEATPVAVSGVTTGGATLAAAILDGRELDVGEWVALTGTGAQRAVTKLSALDLGTLGATFQPALPAAEATALEAAADKALQRVVTYRTQPDFPGDPALEPAPQQGTYLVYLDVWKRHVTALEDGSLREIALGGPDTATRTKTVWQVKLHQVGDTGASVTCATAPAFDTFVGPSTGRLRARAQPQTTSVDLCTIPPGAGYRRLENQLYRVEIHDPGNVGTATFVFSRENGSVVVPVVGQSGNDLTVSDAGRDEVLGFAPGDWIELVDDTHELARQPGTLVQIRTVVGTTLTVDPATATGPLALADPARAKVRRWDDPSGARKVERPAGHEGYLALEDGVEVRFEDGQYNTGDYWLIPARTAGGDVEWPRDDLPRPLAESPEGIVHHYSSLAVARFTTTWEVLEDCRTLFPPLTGVDGGTRDEPGVHVVGIQAGKPMRNLRNDGPLGIDALAVGIDIRCDKDIDSHTVGGKPTKPTCTVVLDLPFPTEATAWGNSPIGTIPLTLNATVNVTGARIHWKPSTQARAWLNQELPKSMQRLKLSTLLVHLTLKGNFVYAAGKPTLNVDGEAFAVFRNGILDVKLPSGDRRRGGDLELWFWLRGKTKRVVVASFAQGRGLTAARQSAIVQAVGLVADRAAVARDLPAGFEVGESKVTDSTAAATRARALIRKVRFGGSLRTVVEEPLMPAARDVAASVARADLGITLDLVSVPRMPATPAGILEPDSRTGLDLVILSDETLDGLGPEWRDAFPAKNQVVL